MWREERDIVVVGGGISGLTVAWHLSRGGADVSLLESDSEVGGAIRTESRDGFLLEKGPFNVMVRDPAFERLLDGLADRVTVVAASDKAENRYIYRHGRLHAVPTGPLAFIRSPLISVSGRLRAMRGLMLSRRNKSGETTIEEFAVRRFGREVADSIVSAAVSGILAGDIHRLSAYACFPVLREFDATSFSPFGRTARRIPAMIRKKRDPKLRRRWKGLVSIDTGLGGLCHAIADTLGDRVHTGARVTSLDREDDRYALNVEGSDGRVRKVTCRRLILATSASVTADLIDTHAPVASELLRTLESASLTVVNLAFRREDVNHPLDGFGFLVPQNEADFPLMGVLFANSAFPHHAPDDRCLLRVFFGGSRTPNVMERSDDSLIAAACDGLRDVLGVRGDPVLTDVCRYPSAIPQYYVDHPQTIEMLRGRIASLPGLTLAGNYLEGVSINDCIKLGERIAEELLAASGPKASPAAVHATKGELHGVSA